MYRANKEISICEGTYYSDVSIFEREDIKTFREYYKTFMELNGLSKDIGCRSLVIPPSFMESLVAYYMGYWKIEGSYAGFDCYSPNMPIGHNRIEIKVGSGKSDYSLFRSRDDWDVLNYVTIYNESIVECAFELFSITKERILSESERFARHYSDKRNLGFRYNIYRELIEHGEYDYKKTFSLFEDL